MAHAFWNIKEVLYEPPDYTANSVDAVMSVHEGYLIGPIIAYIQEAFNGTGTAAIVTIGDGDDADRFLAAGDIDEETADTYDLATGGSASNYAAIGSHLYTGDDTIDVTFTAATGADGTTGQLLLKIFWTRVRP